MSPSLRDLRRALKEASYVADASDLTETEDDLTPVHHSWGRRVVVDDVVGHNNQYQKKEGDQGNGDQREGDNDITRVYQRRSQSLKPDDKDVSNRSSERDQGRRGHLRKSRSCLVQVVTPSSTPPPTILGRKTLPPEEPERRGILTFATSVSELKRAGSSRNIMEHDDSNDVDATHTKGTTTMLVPTMAFDGSDIMVSPSSDHSNKRRTKGSRLSSSASSSLKRRMFPSRTHSCAA